MPESHTFGSEQPDDSIDAVTPKKRRGGSALSRYLFQRRSAELSDTAIESIDTDTESEEKPKRLKGLLGKIFPKIVEKSDIVDQPKKKAFDSEMFFSWAGPIEQEHGQEQIVPDTEQVDFSRDTTEVAARTVAARTEVAIPPIFSEQSNTLASQEQPAEMVGDNTLPSPVEIIASSSPDQPTREHSVGDQPRQSQEQFVRQPETQPSSNAIERETVIERRGSALPYVLLGAEYMARKSADKKLEQRVTDKITETSVEVSRAAQLQQELDTVVQQNREQLEALKQQRHMPEAAASVERSKTAVEIQPDPTLLRIERPAVATEKDQPETVQRKIFEQVAEAAEQNVPVERVFERSHEVKDDKTTPVGAASVGAVMAAKAAQSQAPQGGRSTLAVAAQGDLPVVADRPNTDEYRQAMRAGFWSAVMIIIVGSMAYLMLQ